MKIPLKLLAVTLALTWCQVLNAQSLGARALTGLNNFGLVVENLDEDAAKCGITSEGLETSVRFILQQSKIRIVVNSLDPYIYIAVTVLPDCAAAVGLSVKTGVTILKNGRFAVGGIWEHYALGSGARANASRRVGGQLEEASKRLVSDWSSVNQ